MRILLEDVGMSKSVMKLKNEVYKSLKYFIITCKYLLKL